MIIVLETPIKVPLNLKKLGKTINKSKKIVSQIPSIFEISQKHFVGNSQQCVNFFLSLRINT